VQNYVKLAGPTGLWPDSLLRAQIQSYQIFNDPKILWRAASFYNMIKQLFRDFLIIIFFALSYSRNLPYVIKFLDHWKFDNLEFVLVRVSLAIGQWARLVKISIKLSSLKQTWGYCTIWGNVQIAIASTSALKP